MIEPRRLWIEGPSGKIEASLRLASSPRGGAVIAHPHPLFGGTMHHPVVFHSDRELNRAGWTTLRFNFRGVGESGGSHDEGRGEVEDVAAVVSWLRGIVPGVPLGIVGFSFGAWCGIRCALVDPGVATLIAVGLPVRIYPMDELRNLGRPFAVVQAEDDEFGRPAEVLRATKEANPQPRILVVPGTSHLFPGKAHVAAARVFEAAEDLLGALQSPRS